MQESFLYLTKVMSSYMFLVTEMSNTKNKICGKITVIKQRWDENGQKYNIQKGG